jgi:hypothetical protein
MFVTKTFTNDYAPAIEVRAAALSQRKCPPPRLTFLQDSYRASLSLNGERLQLEILDTGRFVVCRPFVFV